MIQTSQLPTESIPRESAVNRSADNATELRDAFKAAMRRFAATVTIITVSDADSRLGMTATAVASVSASPPAILVCVNRAASIHGNMQMGTLFCVNLLGRDHESLSLAFGGQVSTEQRFSVGSWQLDTRGRPYLTDAQANLFCVVDGKLSYGTHTIFVGRVDAIRLHGETRPLIYGDGRFIDS
jgi:flavin reductase